jgi:uncharacterized membrane protein
MTYVVAYIATAIVFLGLDALWIGKVALGLYRQDMGGQLLDKPNLAVAGLFYLFYIAGIVILAISPALAEGNWLKALLFGAVLGFVAYGTYDFTNLSTLKDYTVRIALTDLAWGTALTAASATIGYWIVKALNL